MMHGTFPAHTGVATANPFHYPSFEIAAYRIEHDVELPVKAAHSRASDLRAFAKRAGLPPDALFSPQAVARLIKCTNAVKAGLSKGRWRNICGSVRWSLRHLGLIRTPLRSQCELLPSWKALRDLVKAQIEFYTALSRLFHFFSANNIDPAEVTPAAFLEFHKALGEAGIKNADNCFRQACRYWNKARAKFPGWPDLTVEVPSFDDSYSLGLSAFPELKHQLEKYIAWHKQTVSSPGHRLLQAPTKKKGAAITQAALERVSYNVRQLASCLHHRGTPCESITLDILADPNKLLDALEFMFERIRARWQRNHPGEEPDADAVNRNAQVHILVCTMITIARDYLKVSAAQQEALMNLRKNVDPVHGVNAQILKDLAPFLENDHMVQFYRQPDLIVADAEAVAEPDWQDGRKMMFALWWRLETRFPFRLTDSLSLRLQKQLVWSGPIETAQFFLHLDHTAKGGKPVHVPVPESIARLLRLWLLKYRRLLIKGENEFLFPGDAPGTPRSSTSFGEGLAELMVKRLGYYIRRHAFRHLATYMYLRACPGDYDGASALLGHRSVLTTIKYYAILRSLKIWENFDKFLLGIEGKKDGTAKGASCKHDSSSPDEI